MSRRVEIFQVDAFTSSRFAGNPAGVVLHADGLQDAEMQALARELNNADTAFVFRATADDHDIRVRFFTPRSEAAFVGHATLAVHAVLQSRDPQALRRQLGKTGIVQVASRKDFNIYEFSYRNDPAHHRYRGVMAQEVLNVPGAVTTMPNGYYAVDYAVLGVPFVQVR